MTSVSQIFRTAVVVSLGLAFNARAQQNPFFDVLQYQIAIQLADSSDAIRGQCDVLLRAVRPARHVVLDLESLKVDIVEKDGAPITFHHDGHQLDIGLLEKTSPGDLLQLKISYAGKPADGLIFKDNKYGRRTIFADNWPNRARYWFPCIDHPADKARVSFRVTAPLRYEVIANGSRVRERNNLNGTMTTEYEETVDISTYCMVFGAAEFDVMERGGAIDTPLSIWSFPEDADDAKQDFSRTDQMLTYFSQHFGSFPYEKLALVQSSTRFGGMENASAIFFAERSLGTPTNIEGTAAHEIVHQWFGDCLTPADWPELWLSEGFATYFGMQFFELADGKDAFRERLRHSRQSYLEKTEWHRRAIVEALPENLFSLLNPNNYDKGGWVLHMLRHQLGDESFWRGIALYAARFRGRNVTTQNLRQVMEEVYGQPLDWFFEQWVMRPGIPDIQIRCQWNDQTKRLLVEAEQKQLPVLRVPVELRFTSRGGKTEDRTIWLVADKNKFNLQLTDAPVDVEVDPDLWLLAKIIVQQGPGSTKE